jgi:hypothetical protein
MQTLFDSLQDAILVVSANDMVAYANSAARKILPLTAGEPLSIESVQGQINAVKRGYLKPPLSFEIDLGTAPKAEQIRVTLLLSPIPSEFIVIMQKATAEKKYQNAISNLAEMIDSSFGAPMDLFLDEAAKMLAQFEAQTGAQWALQEEVAKVSRLGTELTDSLKTIVMLALAYKNSSMRGEERVLISKLVAEVVDASGEVLRARRLKISYCGLNDDLPVIFVSRHFLVQALAGYLCDLGQQLDPGETILISVKNNGNFIALTITSSIANYASVTPESNNQNLIARMRINKSKAQDVPALSLLICKRVIELHGGLIHIGEKTGKTSSITIELPVGAPFQDAHQLGMQQAYRYAEDMKSLLRRKSRAH